MAAMRVDASAPALAVEQVGAATRGAEPSLQQAGQVVEASVVAGSFPEVNGANVLSADESDSGASVSDEGLIHESAPHDRDQTEDSFVGNSNVGPCVPTFIPMRLLPTVERMIAALSGGIGFKVEFDDTEAVERILDGRETTDGTETPDANLTAEEDGAAAERELMSLLGITPGMSHEDQQRTVSKLLFATFIRQVGGMPPKKKRARAEDDEEDDEDGIDGRDMPMIFQRLAIAPNDVKQVRDALALDTVNIGPWLKTLSVEDLEGLEKAAENAGKGGNTKSLTATYAKFVSEYKHLKELQGQVKTSLMYVHVIFRLAYEEFIKLPEPKNGKRSSPAKFTRAVQDALAVKREAAGPVTMQI